MRPIAELPVQYTELWERAEAASDAEARKHEAAANQDREATAAMIKRRWEKLSGFELNVARVVSYGPARERLTIEFDVPNGRSGALTIRGSTERKVSGEHTSNGVEWSVALMRPAWDYRIEALAWYFKPALGLRQGKRPERLEWRWFKTLTSLGNILTGDVEPRRFEVPDRYRVSGTELTWNHASGDYEIN